MILMGPFQLKIFHDSMTQDAPASCHPRAGQSSQPFSRHLWSVTALPVTASLPCPAGCPSASPGTAKPQLSLLELEMLDTASQELEHPEAFLCLSFLPLR